MLSCNIGNYLIKRQSERHIIIEKLLTITIEKLRDVYPVFKFNILDQRKSTFILP